MFSKIVAWFKRTILKDYKKILLVDFDGVLHSYESGWQGANVIADAPVHGAIEWLDYFLMIHCDAPDSICAIAQNSEWELQIYSARSRQRGGIKAMRAWLVKHGLDPRLLDVIKFPVKKPAAFLTIDDRAICFDGDFNSLTKKIEKFKPWNNRNK